jgi:Meiotically up-regulated gene 113
MREQILDEIRALAGKNGGQPPGVRLFERETGIREGAWRGVHWARWSDAVREAGFAPNVKQERFEEEFFLLKLAAACRHYGKFPTASEMRMYQQKDPQFPNAKSITRQFGSLPNVPHRLIERAASSGEHTDLVTMLAGRVPPKPEERVGSKEGLVYLIKSGAHYKIGRSDELERRVKEIRIALPQSAVLVHSIRTDDPSGIEAYWHRRFADRRANGEWFALNASDVAAFKRRRFQ